MHNSSLVCIYNDYSKSTYIMRGWNVVYTYSSNNIIFHPKKNKMRILAIGFLIYFNVQDIFSSKIHPSVPEIVEFEQS